MSSCVLDSSAIIALLDEERGADVVWSVLHRSAVSTVNLAEVYTKLNERGQDGRTAVALIVASLDQVEPYTHEQAVVTGVLRERTSKAGLSLGDRACLALALSLNAEVYTSDQAWRRVKVGCTINFIR